MLQREIPVISTERRTIPMRTRIGKWSGLWCGAAAAFLDQQVVAQTIYTKCPEGSTQFALTVGMVCALISLFGAVFSAVTYRNLPSSEDGSASARTDRFIAALSILMACFALLFVIFASSAGLFLRCER
jgi:hypothetical protein